MGLLGTDGGELATLAIYGFGIALYALAVALLYAPLSTRMMFARRFGERQVATPGRRFAYVFLFPIVSFLFFVIIAGATLFMGSFGSAEMTPRDVLLTSMAVVLAVRICAYFSEGAAADLAKVMPLGLLGVVLVTNGFEGLGESLRNLRALVDEARLLALFFVAVVAVEFFLRSIYELLGRPSRKRVMGRPVVQAARR